MRCHRYRGDRDIKLFWIYAEALRKNAPPLVPVKIRRVDKVLIDGKECGGGCDLIRDKRGRPKHFLIQIEKRIRGREMLDALEHEWGHAYGWTTDHPIHDDHGDIWALARGRAYRVLEGVL